MRKEEGKDIRDGEGEIMGIKAKGQIKFLMYWRTPAMEVLLLYTCETCIHK